MLQSYLPFYQSFSKKNSEVDTKPKNHTHDELQRKAMKKTEEKLDFGERSYHISEGTIGEYGLLYIYHHIQT